MSLRKRYSFVKSFSPELMYGSPGKYRKLSEDELYEEWLRQHSNILTPSPEQEKEAPEFTKIYLNGPKLSSEKGLNLSAESFDSSNGNEEETSNDGENKRGNEIANESWFNSLEESNVDGVFSAPKSNYPQTNSLTRTTSEANENRHGQIENKGEIENFEIVASKQEFTCNKPVLSRGSSSGGSSCSGSEKYNRKNAVECDPPDVDTENSDEEMGKPHSKGKYSFREAETAFGVESSLPRSTENLQHYVIRSNSSQNGEVIVEDSAVQFGWKRSEFGPNYEQIIVAENPVEMQVSTANYHQEATPSGMEDLKVAYYGPVYLYPRDGPDSSTPRTVRALSVSSTSSSTADGAITGYHLDSTVSDNEKDREHRSSVEFGLSKWDNADFEVREEMSFQEETPQMTPRSDVEATTSIPKESIKQKARTSSTSSSSSSSSSDSEKEKGSVEAENSKEHGLDKDISVSETIRVTVPSERVGVDSPDFNRYNDSDATTKELSVESQIQIVGPAAMEFSTFLKSPGAVNKNASDSKPFVKELEVSSPEPIRTPDIQPMLSPFELESVQLSEDQQSLKVETNIQSPQEKELRLKTTDIQPSVGLEAPKFGDNSVDISTDVQSTNIGASVECPAVQDSVKTDINSNQHSDAPTKESTISPDTVAFLRSMTDSETEFFDAPEIVASKSLTAQCSPPRYNIDGQEGDNDRQTPPSLEVSVSQDNDGVPSHLPVMPSCRIGSPKIRSTDSSERELRGDDKPPTITIDGIPNDHETSVTQPTSPEIQMSVRPKTKIGDDKKSEIAIGHSPENKREELSIKTNNGDRSFTSSSSNSLSSNDEIKQHEGDDVISVSSDEIIDHIQRQDSALSETEDETSFMTADTSVQHVDANFKVNTGLEVSEPVIHARTVSGTNAEIHKVIDKLDEIVVRHSDCVSVDSGTSSGGRHHGHFVVVAIDFGTTFSGYGFSFTRDPDSIHMMRKWEGGDPGVINQKTPTTMLLTPDGTFHSFGFSARNYYHDLEPKESKKWLYFEKFKMILHHKQDLCKDTKIKASNGKPFPALMVFSYALRFFKEKALNELSDQSGMKIINEDIRWVITVPAIWKEPAKQFMRRAAYEAGIVSPEYPEQLLVALEPEAASIYCRKLRMYQLVPDYVEKRPLVPPKDVKPDPLNLTLACEELSVDGNEAAEGKIFEHSISYNTVENLVRGSKYMVVDCGGGTVDITVHELDDTGKLRELHKATGGPYGSMGVDLKFERLLCDIFGNDYIEKYKNEKPAGWVDLMIAFESRKQAASPFKTTPLNVSLPFSFIDHYKKTRKGHVDKAIKKYGDKEIVWSYDGMLRLSKVAMSRLFDETIEKIKEAVAVVLEEPDCKGLRYIFLVGGFSESPVLQDEMRQKFGHLLKVIIPRDTSMSVLKGAVMFGIDPTIVHVRRSRLTYGVGILNRYNKEKHPKENLVRRDSIDWCTNVFDKFVVVDQSIALGDVVVRSYTPARAKQKTSIINIYCSDKDTVSFITDPGVRKCGTLCLDIASLQGEDQRKRREIKTKMFFGDTEIKVSATDVSSGKCVRASIDFLNK